MEPPSLIVTLGYDVLPNAQIETAEENTGCVEGKAQTAALSLQSKLPLMVAAVGIQCSSDVEGA